MFVYLSFAVLPTASLVGVFSFPFRLVASAPKYCHLCCKGEKKTLQPSLLLGTLRIDRLDTEPLQPNYSSLYEFN